MKSFMQWLSENTPPGYPQPNTPVASFGGAAAGLPPTNPNLTTRRDNVNLSKLLQAAGDTAAGMQINNYLQQSKNATATLAFAQKQFPQLVSKVLGASGANVPAPPPPRVPMAQDPRNLAARPLPGTQMPPPPGGIR